MKPDSRLPDAVAYGSLGLCALAALALSAVLFLDAARRPARIRTLHAGIGGLQEKLIGAEITSRRVEKVKELIARNVAYGGGGDTLAQGASLPFLRDLTGVLDALRIGLVSLEPEKPVASDRYVESPYRVEILCDYNQFCQLANKMEKSPRLISIKEFELENGIDQFFAGQRPAGGQCRIRMRISTLTLLRRPS